MPQANTLTIHMIAALAQYEREPISKRTREALVIAKRHGTVLGSSYLDEVRNSDTTAARAQMVAYARERNNQVRELISEYGIEEGRELSSRKLSLRLNDGGYTTARVSRFRIRRIYASKLPLSPLVGRKYRITWKKYATNAALNIRSMYVESTIFLSIMVSMNTKTQPKTTDAEPQNTEQMPDFRSSRSD